MLGRPTIKDRSPPIRHIRSTQYLHRGFPSAQGPKLVRAPCVKSSHRRACHAVHLTQGHGVHPTQALYLQPHSVSMMSALPSEGPIMPSIQARKVPLTQTMASTQSRKVPTSMLCIMGRQKDERTNRHTPFSQPSWLAKLGNNNNNTNKQTGVCAC